MKPAGGTSGTTTKDKKRRRTLPHQHDVASCQNTPLSGSNLVNSEQESSAPIYLVDCYVILPVLSSSFQLYFFGRCSVGGVDCLPYFGIPLLRNPLSLEQR